MVDRVFCAGCGEPLPPRPPGKRGPAPIWCSEACRSRKRRAEREPVSWETAVATSVPAPVDRVTRAEATVRATAALIEGTREQLAPVDQLAEAAQMTRELGWQLARLGREDGLPPRMQAAAGTAAEHVERAVAALGGGSTW